MLSAVVQFVSEAPLIVTCNAASTTTTLLMMSCTFAFAHPHYGIGIAGYGIVA